MATINGRTHGLGGGIFGGGIFDGVTDAFDDRLSGTSSADTMNGFGGNDDIFGNGGNDTINGGAGNDFISGGSGFDRLTGGSGRDTFAFRPGDSGPSYSGADIITDFNSTFDTILFQTNSPAGNSSNYHEERISLGLTHQIGYNIALEEAREDIGGGVRFAFYTNGHDGYLFADLDNNGTVDTGIELRGLDSLRDFSFTDIH